MEDRITVAQIGAAALKARLVASDARNDRAVAANGIEAPIGVKGGTPMDGETIAEKAKAFTVRVNCR